jgi:hypothetical protein
MSRYRGADLLAALAVSVAVLGLVLAARCECAHGVIHPRLEPVAVGGDAE